ncbi:MAG: CheR family methyltransferase [Roseiflexaceae bacterium]|nr:tetratricopeptide repeat protein [Roseiflexus sp.]MDW8145225.1 CheR family methyltransferase [Roseiflexaceae bacterium]MDW8234240.1 CheR family methyltransferase [Roseiflexaceae bacterium]
MDTAPDLCVLSPVRLSPEAFDRLRTLLADYSGVYLDTAQQRVLEAGLAQRMAALGETLEAYERRISAPSGRSELHRLAEMVVNHETFFFRNAPHMRALRETLLFELHRCKPPGEPIRIWSAGCATGEEAYSLAITVLETFGSTIARPVEIWATDLSELALEKARAGFYRGRSLNNVTPALLNRYFVRQGDGFLVSDAVRALVRFEQLNLLEAFPPTAYGVDAIFCQNVTIYFRPETRRSLIERFYRCLPAHGLLFLGFSETLWNVFDGFRSREVAGAYVYQKVERPDHSVPRRTMPRRPTPTGEIRRRSPLIVEAPHTTSRERRPSDDLLASEPNNEDASRIEQARTLIDAGKINEAMDLLRRVRPNSLLAPRALVLVARVHADRGELDLAVAEARRALEIDALSSDAYLLIGTIYARQGQWNEAIQALERARYLDPDTALISYHLALAYKQAGKTERATREFRNALRKLAAYRSEDLIEGVEVGWLRASCEQHLGM